MAEQASDKAGAPEAAPASTPGPETPAPEASGAKGKASGAKSKSVSMVRIVAKRPGFRRCGIAHPETATLYPLDRFTKDQLSALQAERWLVVDLVKVDAETGEPA